MGATTPKEFNSRISLIGKFGQGCQIERIKNEPMFFNSSFAFAMEKGGAITKSFLSNLHPNGKILN